MHRKDVIRTTVGIIGNIISALLLPPVFNDNTTDGFHPYPYLATMMACILSIFVRPHTTLALTIINGLGLTMQIMFLGIFLITYTKKKYREVIGLYLLTEIALVAVISLLCFPRTRSLIMVGTICDFFRVITFTSPVSIVWKVVRTKNAKFVPVWLCLAGFCNGVCWFGYAFMIEKFDPYLAFGSGIGAVFGFIQIVLWLCYTFWGRKKSADSKNILII